jgi:DNA-binding CsgD family transcriptional regulator
VPLPPLEPLLTAARDAPDLPSWRRRALEVLGGAVPFDKALFHELSPRAPLTRAALVGLDVKAVEAGLGGWDASAVELGRLRDLALVQEGVASDAEAFPQGSKGRRAWDARVGRPLGVASALLAHLVVRERLVAGVLLGRARGKAPFTPGEREALARLVPALAVGDALQQALAAGGERPPAGLVTRLVCVDQRLTPRQREVVVHVALGHTNAAIGRALGISPNTVRNTLVQVCARLGAANRAEVVRLAVLR